MTAGSVARRYAKALFEIGKEEGNLLTLLTNVQQMADIWLESEALRETMTSPKVSATERRGIWTQIASRSGITMTGRYFLNLLIDKSRLDELPAIARELAALADDMQNRLRAEVVTAVPISKSVEQNLKSALERLTGKIVILTMREDPEIIGGMVTHIGDTLFDGSIKTQLQRLKENMLGRA